MPGRRYEISDVYVMVLTFLIFFSVTKIVKEVIQKRGNAKELKIQNPRGGAIEVQLSDDNELAFTILTCIADNEQYLVKNPRLIEWVFGLVKAKIKNESLVLTPNMMRFLALRLVNPNQSFIGKIGNLVISSNNRVRLFNRVSGAAIIGLLSALSSGLPYAILMILIYFEGTQNCGYPCDEYFQHLPPEGHVRIYSEQSTGHLAMAEAEASAEGKDDARQVEIYIPSKSADEVIISNTGEKIIKKSYRISRKKAKEVKFSDFKEKDPVLKDFARFKDLEEPDVPQKPRLINDAHDIIDLDLRIEE